MTRSLSISLVDGSPTGCLPHEVFPPGTSYVGGRTSEVFPPSTSYRGGRTSEVFPPGTSYVGGLTFEVFPTPVTWEILPSIPERRQTTWGHKDRGFSYGSCTIRKLFIPNLFTTYLQGTRLNETPNKIQGPVG